MTLGEIKLESLRLMNANDENLNKENLENYEQDDRYREYLDRMPGAINRAISRFMTYKVIPLKTKDIKPSEGEILKQFLKLDLKKILPDFNALERVIYINEKVIPNIEYQTIGDGIVLIEHSPNFKEEEIFSIEYEPVIEMITASTENNKKIDIPEALARMIPYFVKADLYEHDEPQIAISARNIFESALTEYISFGLSRKQKQQYVKNVMY